MNPLENSTATILEPSLRLVLVHKSQDLRRGIESREVTCTSHDLSGTHLPGNQN